LPQSSQRLDVNATVDNGQIRALHQSKAPLSCKERVLKVGLVVRARREDYDGWIRTIRGSQGEKSFTFHVKESGYMADPAFIEYARKGPRGNQSVLQGISHA